MGGSLDTSLHFRVVAEELPIASLISKLTQNFTCTSRRKAVFTAYRFKFARKTASIKTSTVKTRDCEVS